MAFDDSVRLIWSLTSAGLATGTTISAAGNSGGYTASTPNARSAVDLRRVDDLWLSVYVGGITGSPAAVTVSLNGFDDLGNSFALGSLTGISTAGAKGPLFVGRHGAASSATAYAVFPEWGQVAWISPSPGTLTGVEICLYAR